MSLGDASGAAEAVALVAMALVLLAAVILLRFRHQARMVERALHLEVASLRLQAQTVAAEIARRHNASEPFDPAFFALWRLSAPLIYPGIGAAFGRLSGEARDRLGGFYAPLADARERWAEARAIGAFAPSPYRVLACLVHAINHVEPWLSSMPGGLDIILREAPDMSEANALLGRLERDGAEPVSLAYCWADTAQWSKPEED